ncbi:TSUP family transporter [Flavobacteriales bacterium]|nr:TSUP family transporter [Flavobacteriales bacterium]
MPFFALFFPLEIAIALTGVAHLLNTLFKMYLVGKEAKWRIVIQFGATGVVSALIGAWILMSFSETAACYIYSLGAKEFMITYIKVMIVILIFAFSFLELLPFFKKLEFDVNKLFFGGVISGFFGGLSVHQGALRSAFLI